MSEPRHAVACPMSEHLYTPDTVQPCTCGLDALVRDATAFRVTDLAGVREKAADWQRRVDWLVGLLAKLGYDDTVPTETNSGGWYPVDRVEQIFAEMARKAALWDKRQFEAEEWRAVLPSLKEDARDARRWRAVKRQIQGDGLQLRYYSKRLKNDPWTTEERLELCDFGSWSIHVLPSEVDSAADALIARRDGE